MRESCTAGVHGFGIETKRHGIFRLCDLMKQNMAPAEETVEAKRLLMRVATALCELGSCAKYCIISNQCFFPYRDSKNVCLFCKGIHLRKVFLSLMNVVRIQIYNYLSN